MKLNSKVKQMEKGGGGGKRGKWEEEGGEEASIFSDVLSSPWICPHSSSFTSSSLSVLI